MDVLDELRPIDMGDCERIVGLSEVRADGLAGMAGAGAVFSSALVEDPACESAIESVSTDDARLLMRAGGAGALLDLEDSAALPTGGRARGSLRAGTIAGFARLGTAGGGFLTAIGDVPEVSSVTSDALSSTSVAASASAASLSAANESTAAAGFGLGFGTGQVGWPPELYLASRALTPGAASSF
jgi:hypothetical protein